MDTESAGAFLANLEKDQWPLGDDGSSAFVHMNMARRSIALRVQLGHGFQGRARLMCCCRKPAGPSQLLEIASQLAIS